MTPPNKHMQPVGIHKVPGRKRGRFGVSHVGRARVLIGQGPGPDAGRQATSEE